MSDKVQTMISKLENQCKILDTKIDELVTSMNEYVTLAEEINSCSEDEKQEFVDAFEKNEIFNHTSKKFDDLGEML